MEEVKDQRELKMIFQSTRKVGGYHILCFEDIDRCNFLKDKEAESFRLFINELDGIIEIPKRIVFLTANNESILTAHKSLIRPGRIDKAIKIDYCTAKQVEDLFNHYTDRSEKMKLETISKQITPATIIKYVIENPEMAPEEFKMKLLK